MQLGPRALLGAALLGLLAAPSLAQGLGLGFGVSDMAVGGGPTVAPPSPVAPPLDGLTAATSAYGFRKLWAAYAGPAVKLRRASDSATQDIGFAGDNFNVAAAAGFCSATSCFLDTWYDQVATRNLVQATAGTQPAYVADCGATRPCARTTVGHQMASAATMTPATGVVTLNAMTRRTAGTAACTWLRENSTGNRMVSQGVADTWQILGGASGSVVATAVDGVWHSALGIVAGASSRLGIDGTEVTGTATGNTVAGPVLMLGGAGATCDYGELAFWDNYQMTAPERVALTNNQQQYWAP